MTGTEILLLWGALSPVLAVVLTAWYKNTKSAKVKAFLGTIIETIHVARPEYVEDLKKQLKVAFDKKGTKDEFKVYKNNVVKGL